MLVGAFAFGAVLTNLGQQLCVVGRQPLADALVGLSVPDLGDALCAQVADDGGAEPVYAAGDDASVEEDTHVAGGAHAVVAVDHGLSEVEGFGVGDVAAPVFEGGGDEPDAVLFPEAAGVGLLGDVFGVDDHGDAQVDVCAGLFEEFLEVEYVFDYGGGGVAHDASVDGVVEGLQADFDAFQSGVDQALSHVLGQTGAVGGDEAFHFRQLFCGVLYEFG